jgi:hypothetical protein
MKVTDQMTHYVWLNSERLQNARSEEELDGIDLIVNLSPYSTPRKIAGEYLPQKGVFQIKFNYFDQEHEKGPVEHKGVLITEGKYTGKIMSISIPVDSPLLDNTCVIQLQTRALAALEDRGKGLGERLDVRLNQSVAKEVIEHDLHELVGA